MFSDPKFWVAVSFVLFIAAIFNPVRKILISSLDNQIKEIKNKIQESEDVKKEAEKILSELKKRETEVDQEINVLKKDAEKRISLLKDLSSKKLQEQIEKRKSMTENKIDQLIRDTNTGIKNYISNVSIEATAYILKNILPNNKKSELINSSIKELNSILKK